MGEIQSSKPLLVARNVSKDYGNTRALTGITLSINAGEIVALIGPSGSGKTTLLNIIAGVIQPDIGEIELNGKLLDQSISRKVLSQSVGLINQQYSLVPNLPVIHNVLAGNLGKWGMFKAFLSLMWPQDKNSASGILSCLGIADKINERTAHLSGGEQQRVAIARTLIQAPTILLADEPVSSLDPFLAEIALKLLSATTLSNNRALIISLHSPHLIKTYCSRVIGVQHGELGFDIPASEVTDHLLEQFYETNA